MKRIKLGKNHESLEMEYDGYKLEFEFVAGDFWVILWKVADNEHGWEREAGFAVPFNDFVEIAEMVKTAAYRDSYIPGHN
jgi:hypothetical protein